MVTDFILRYSLRILLAAAISLLCLVYCVLDAEGVLSREKRSSGENPKDYRRKLYKMAFVFYAIATVVALLFVVFYARF
jgi:hypothetical protein